MWQSWGPRETVGARRKKCEKLIAKMRRERLDIRPVEISGRKITTTFWGDAWCENMESYADYAYRIDRGRSYVRNLSVIDLRETGNGFTAQVYGSEIYEVEFVFTPLKQKTWDALKQTCAGKVDSLINLLSGSLDDSVMQHMANPKTGLFPKPSEISVSCSCPDHAILCKHAAAVLYGIGHRLDTEPELLFKLRQVDHTELAGSATAAISHISSESSDFNNSEIADIFGIDIELDDPLTPSTPTAKKAKKVTMKKAAKKTAKKAAKKTAKKVAKKVAQKSPK